MPPKRASGAGRGRPKGSTSKKAAKAPEPETSDPFASSEEEQEPAASREVTMIEDDEPEQEKTIPKELLTRVLHEFFARDATRMSRDANAAVGKYFDVFVREAIARAAVEKEGGFLEVEDLEKISPQLLLDL
ncbi:Fc.00g015940.m01.CDS01 [Cosmosporella sp. VM-42]